MSQKIKKKTFGFNINVVGQKSVREIEEHAATCTGTAPASIDVTTKQTHQQKQVSSARHVCPVCSKSFLAPELVERHIDLCLLNSSITA